jgi:hypothetical protein
MYVIIVVPALIPVTTPVPASMVAFDVLLLLQVPPPVLFESVVAEPGQTVSVPLIAESAAFTVTSVTLKHPALTE